MPTLTTYSLTHALGDELVDSNDPFELESPLGQPLISVDYFYLANYTALLAMFGLVGLIIAYAMGFR